ncbi:Mediator of RNA polymerase II transcription subunit 6 [Hondaea fermentalgiana]|uniref:Mediator of RNA polymerase II transcription subunit 6 n=1 Tax=Hondaea fermentalgiana TaxID=2315210 RepID=A0A2R5H113_9STRA|nr:Mediator of RNA polymerase II transcription subunit 6 [Hondaea fermentalgiana]|eukprot:GBG34763.1 Mediator of RNA polymerase II transcription subunit 6 [Hondaea fermentalgiana]
METWAVKKPKRALQALSETAAPTPRRKRARPQSSSSDPLNGFEDASFLRLCGPVSVENALEYFARSPFYDPSCNNERLRARNLDADALVFMKGVEFSLYESSFDHLFIILKQRRFSSTMVQRLAAYYILDNRIYEAPALRSLLASRLGQCAMHLEKAVTKMAEIHAATPDRPVPPLLRIGPTSGGLSGGGPGGGGLGTPHGSSADLDVSRRMRSDSLARGPSSPLHPSVHTVSSLAQQPAYQHQQYYSPHQQHHQQPQRRLGPPMLKRARSVDDQVKGLLHVVVSKFLPANIVPGNLSSRPSTAHRSSHGLSTPTND